ncbi:hypothetical protein CAOG_06218 [Capsaspora owczarzaki ATCC 30864]|uniref:hypothetical protein n=1 Tax=Capsaspora owczarzaki (strain ATCC 30864) TaxID=595528 RepID=UPI0001FE3C75|nr:hypothetical protein CAOG_06218 [Capsaspora owczarzaki ATCC 30864]|eukprot:XP_004344967.1 hypothetical protein CAOG_06218 [Capsaspora owczarzaki ATCC 30864]
MCPMRVLYLLLLALLAIGIGYFHMRPWWEHEHKHEHEHEHEHGADDASDSTKEDGANAASPAMPHHAQTTGTSRSVRRRRRLLRLAGEGELLSAQQQQQPQSRIELILKRTVLCWRLFKQTVLYRILAVITTAVIVLFHFELFTGGYFCTAMSREVIPWMRSSIPGMSLSSRALLNGSGVSP